LCWLNIFFKKSFKKYFLDTTNYTIRLSTRFPFFKKMITTTEVIDVYPNVKIPYAPCPYTNVDALTKYGQLQLTGANRMYFLGQFLNSILAPDTTVTVFQTPPPLPNATNTPTTRHIFIKNNAIYVGVPILHKWEKYRDFVQANATYIQGLYIGDSCAQPGAQTSIYDKEKTRITNISVWRAMQKLLIVCPVGAATTAVVRPKCPKECPVCGPSSGSNGMELALVTPRQFTCACRCCGAGPTTDCIQETLSTILPRLNVYEMPPLYWSQRGACNISNRSIWLRTKTGGSGDASDTATMAEFLHRLAHIVVQSAEHTIYFDNVLRYLLEVAMPFRGRASAGILDDGLVITHAVDHVQALSNRDNPTKEAGWWNQYNFANCEGDVLPNACMCDFYYPHITSLTTTTTTTQ
jgi:hypothetical protein